MAAWAVTTGNSSLAFGTGGYPFQVHKIDANHVICLYRDSAIDGFVESFVINTTTWAVTTAAANLEFNTTNAWPINSVKIDTNHFLVVFGAADYDGFAQIITVDTTTWAVTTANSALEFLAANTLNNNAQLSLIDANHVLCTLSNDSSDVIAQVLAINTTTWAVTTTVAWNDVIEASMAGSYAGSNRLVKIDTNHWCTILGHITAPKSVSIVVNTTTWAIATAGALGDVTADEAIPAWINLAMIDATHFIAAIGMQTGYLRGQVFVVNTSTWAITTAAAAAAISNGGASFDVDNDIVSVVDSNHFLVTYKGSASDGYASSLSVNTSTWAITVESTLEYELTDFAQPAIVLVDTNHVLSCWSASGNGAAQILTTELAAAGPANLKTYNTNLKANVKSINTNLIANVKTLNTNS